MRARMCDVQRQNENNFQSVTTETASAIMFNGMRLHAIPERYTYMRNSATDVPYIYS